MEPIIFLIVLNIYDYIEFQNNFTSVLNKLILNLKNDLLIIR
jgi:hypothetical protein